MFNLINYKIVPENTLRVHGTEFSVEDITTGKVYVSDKDYINKLFGEMGYRNLNVIKILEEFAGKIVTDIGQLKRSKIYINDTDSSFCVTDPVAFANLDNLDIALTTEGFRLLSENSTTCVNKKEYLVQSPIGVCFSLRISLADEIVEILSIHVNEQGVTDGIMYEGEYKLTDSSIVASILTTMKSNVNAAALVRVDEKVSLNEYVELLKGLGLAKLNRRTNVVHLTDEGMSISQTAIGSEIEGLVSDYNAYPPLARHVVDIGKTYGECFNFASQFVDASPWNTHSFYSKNINETNDFAQLATVRVNG